jgi:hypothetical protein
MAKWSVNGPFLDQFDEFLTALAVGEAGRSAGVR